MSEKLPVVSGKTMIKVLEKFGFVVDRIKGSHHVMKKDGHVQAVTVPNHNELKRGTTKGILNAAGISNDEFRNSL